MKHWLFKTEPREFSIDDLASAGTSGWDGVRNHEARNRLRDQVGVADRVLIQHSGRPRPTVVGLAEVVREGYPDPGQFDPKHAGHDPKASPQAPRWYQVDIRFLLTFDRPVPLSLLRGDPVLANSEPVKRARLSIQKLSQAEYEYILSLSGAST